MHDHVESYINGRPDIWVVYSTITPGRTTISNQRGCLFTLLTTEQLSLHIKLLRKLFTAVLADAHLVFRQVHVSFPSVVLAIYAAYTHGRSVSLRVPHYVCRIISSILWIL